MLTKMGGIEYSATGTPVMIYDRMIRITYSVGSGETLTTIANFSSDKSEQDLQLQIDDHCNRYGVIRTEYIEPQDLTFDDLSED